MKLLRSSSLSLRRAAVACLRQLSQRESRQLWEIVSGQPSPGIKNTHQVAVALVVVVVDQVFFWHTGVFEAQYAVKKRKNYV